MARIPFVNVGEIGIVKDISPADLPPNAWSDGRNVRFVNGHVEKSAGRQVAFTPQVDVQFALTVEAPNGYYWLYVGDQDAYAYADGVSNLATRASGLYTAAGDNGWTGGVLNGVAVLNSFTEVPQAWTSPGAGNRLVNLPNWNLSWRARSMRPFLNYLVALGVKKGSTDNPYLVSWSHVADPGTVPSTWDETDPTNDAGSAILADTSGHLVDQMTLGSANIVYKSDSTYAMRHVGGIDIMGFKRVLKSDGLLTPNAMAEFQWRGDKQAAFGSNELYWHDGNTSEPVLHKRMRDWVFNTIDQDNYSTTFVAHNKGGKEIWLCFPQAGAGYPNIAVVWNYQDNTTTIKEIPETMYIAEGKVLSVESSSGSVTWANVTGTWESSTDRWGNSAYSSKHKRLLAFTRGVGRKAYLEDSSMLYGSTVYESYVERIGLSAFGKDPISGKPIFNSDQVKIVTEVWPRIEAELGTEIEIFIGSQETQDKPIKWNGPYKFIAGKMAKINPYVNGKILSIRFGAKAGVFWKLSGYDLEVVSGGSY